MRCVSVLGVAVAVMLMHAMGVGHHAAATSPMTSMAMTSMAATASDSGVPSQRAANLAQGVCDHDCTDASQRADPMGGPMCLAVLTILTLLLPGRGGLLWARDLARVTPTGRCLPVLGRAPPPHLTPSLSRLCVLRT